MPLHKEATGIELHIPFLTNAGNPNGVLTGKQYQFCWDTTNKRLYVNTDGATAWSVGVPSIGGDTFTGKILFSGTDHAGIELVNLTTSQRDALTPADGDLIYNTSDNKLYYYNGTAWTEVGGGGGAADDASGIIANQVFS